MRSQVMKVESSEDIGRQELEEGKTSSVSDFLIRSPNIQKKRMDFGHTSQNEYIWLYTKQNQLSSQLNDANQHNLNPNQPTLVEKMRLLDIRTSKIVDKWDRSFVLDKRGKLYEWQTSREVTLDENKVSDDPAIKEIDQEIDGGKMLSKLGIKDIGCTSSSLFLATENGEVIVGKAIRKDEEVSQNDSQISETNQEAYFMRKGQKIGKEIKINLSFQKLNSIQSHFIAHLSCGNNHVVLLTSSGFVYSFGKNEYGQLGHSSAHQDVVSEPTILFQLLNLKVSQISCGKHHTVAIGTSRDTIASTFQIYSTEHALFTTIDKNKTLVYAWGQNKYGQLGLDDEKDRQVPTLVEKVLDWNFKKVKCGAYHTGLLEESQGNLFLCGNNEFGQIGIKDTDKQRVPISVFQQMIDSDQLNNNQNNYLDGDVDNPQVIVTSKYVIDFICSRYSTVCFTDDQEVYLWGKNIIDPTDQTIINEPMLICKLDEQALNISQDDNQMVEKIFAIKDVGIALATRQRLDKDEGVNSGGGFKFDPNDQSFASYLPLNKDQSFQTSGAASFLGKHDAGGYNTIQPTPYAGANTSTGISFSSEFQNLLQYIAITAGNTKMPDGIKPMTFRPGNLPPKTQEEERLHQKLVEENRKQYLKKVKEREKAMEKQRQEQEKKDKKILELKEIWENEILPNWDQVKRTKRVRELWVEGIPPVVRGRVWYYAFGNRNSITKELYNIMAQRGAKIRKLLKELSTIDQEIIDHGGQPQRNRTTKDKSNDDKGNLYMTSKLSLDSQQQQLSPQLTSLQNRYDKLRKKLKLLIGPDVPQNSNTSSVLTSYQSREKSLSIIETDLPRTFPQLGFFKPDGSHYQSLQRLLEAFTIHRCDIGYVQGMSYVAAVLLLYMEEEQAFVTLSNMLTKFPIMPFYQFNESQIRKILQLFKQVFAHNLPDLCEHLEMENIQPKQYVYEWFMTLFTRALNLSLVSRVWDFYFLDGIFVLYQTAIAILRILEKHMIDEEFEDIMRVLKNVSDYVTDEEELVTFIYDVSFPKWVYDEIPKLESEFLKTI